MQTHSPKVLVNEVSVTFESHGHSLLALDRISLEVAAGEFLCIVGPSGSGKSTLLRVLAGLLRQSAGEVRIEADRPGTPLTAMVFQEHALLPWRTVLANVTFGLENRGVGRAAREARAREMLALVGLARFARHYPHQLSGGMKQRVGIARALANDPEVLLMDEPFAALDAQTRTLMQEELLRIWATLGKTVIYVTHSLEEALLLGDRVVLLTSRPGRVSQVFPVDLGRPRGLEVRASHAYGALLEKIWSQLREEVVRAMAEEGTWGTQVKRIADLKGRPVALNTRGAAVEWMLDQMLRRDGITIKDVQIKIMPFPDMVPALEVGAVDAGIITEPFPTLAEEKGVGVRPIPRPAGAKAIPITATLWNAEWAKANPDLAHRVMLGYVRAVRNLAADGGRGWHEDKNVDIMVKYTGAKREVIKRARPHVVDPNLDLDASLLDSMQKLNADLGYLKYTEFLSADKLFTFTYLDRALRELGRR